MCFLILGCGSPTAPAAVPAQPAESPAAPALSTVDDVVKEVVAAYGGAEAVRRLASSRVRATVTPLVRNLGGSGKVRRDFSAPHRLRVEIVYPTKTELRILDGSTGWRGTVDRPVAARGPALVAMHYQLLRLHPAWALSAHRDRLRDVSHHVQREKIRILRLRWSPALFLDYEIDADSWHVTRVRGQLEFGQMVLNFATEYGVFSRVDGALVPFAEENYASGRHTASTRIDSIEMDARDLGPFAP